MTNASHPLAGVVDAVFVSRLRSQLKSLIYHFRGVRVDFDDLFQEVWLRLYESPPERAHRDTEAYREYVLAFGSVVAKQRLIDAARRKSPLTNVELVFSSESGVEPTPDDDEPAAIWQAVNRVAEALPDPPPRAFIRAWCELRQNGVRVTEEQVTRWQGEFKRSRATVRRWLQDLKSEILARVVYGEREAHL
jgi:DNA-directed RNA polymerase specialized sigma24 family protein